MPLVNQNHSKQSFVKCFINGEEHTRINIEDRALHYGDGLFETMLYHDGEITLWSQHIARLKSGCDALGLHLIEEDELLRDLKKLTNDLKNKSYIIKLIVSRGAAGRGLVVNKNVAPSCILLAYNFDVKALKNAPAKALKVCKTRLMINKTLGGIKHLNRLLYVLAADELEQNHSEGIMLNDKDEMIECITHNLFFAKNNVLYTAPINDCGVAGIKRQQVIEKAKDLNIPVKIEAILLKDLKQMDECFMTNAVVGLQSVQSIDHITFTTKAMTQKLQNNLNL